MGAYSKKKKLYCKWVFFFFIKTAQTRYVMTLCALFIIVGVVVYLCAKKDLGLEHCTMRSVAARWKVSVRCKWQTVHFRKLFVTAARHFLYYKSVV